MRKAAERENWVECLGRAASALLLVAGLAFLIGCQGLSAGGSSLQQQISTLSANYSLAFGSVAAGSSKTLPITISNSGSASVTISSVAISTKYFSLVSPSLPLTVAAGQNASISVKFTPNEAGAFNATAAITSNASDAVMNVALSGAGTASVVPGQLTLSPASEVFGNVSVGAEQSQTVTLTNTGGSSVDISQVSVNVAGFQISGITTPLTLNASQDTSFTVSFAPQSSGSVNGMLTITSDGANPTLSMALSGTGISTSGLSATPPSEAFGSVTVGSNQTLSEMVTNTGGTSVTISQVGISGSGFSLSGITAPVTLTAGQSATFTVTFTPTAAASASGTITLTSNATNPTLTIPLSGTGVAPGALGASPTSLSFGSVTVGSNQTLSETVTNTGGTSVTISQVGISGSGFSLSGITAPVTLTAGQSASFTVTFTPTAAGSASGTITLTSNATNPTLTIPLSGTGVAPVGQLSVSPATLSLGSVVVGTSGSASGSLTASGASVTVSAVSSTNSVFSVGGLSLPVTIPAGQSTSFSVTFSPRTAGAANATLTFTSNAQPSTTTETVTGTGEAPPTYIVDLSWDASTSANISGYNVYRAVYTSSCGSFTMINPTLNTSTSYTDSSVTDGTSYCYTTTAVNASNQESVYSNIVSNVQIPAP